MRPTVRRLASGPGLSGRGSACGRRAHVCPWTRRRRPSRRARACALCTPQARSPPSKPPAAAGQRPPHQAVPTARPAALSVLRPHPLLRGLGHQRPAARLQAYAWLPPPPPPPPLPLLLVPLFSALPGQLLPLWLRPHPCRPPLWLPLSLQARQHPPCAGRPLQPAGSSRACAAPAPRAAVGLAAGCAFVAVCERHQQGLARSAVSMRASARCSIPSAHPQLLRPSAAGQLLRLCERLERILLPAALHSCKLAQRQRQQVPRPPGWLPLHPLQRLLGKGRGHGRGCMQLRKHRQQSNSRRRGHDAPGARPPSCPPTHTHTHTPGTASPGWATGGAAACRSAGAVPRAKSAQSRCTPGWRTCTVVCVCVSVCSCAGAHAAFEGSWHAAGSRHRQPQHISARPAEHATTRTAGLGRPAPRPA
jgi:hypothetical protein